MHQTVSLIIICMCCLVTNSHALNSLKQFYTYVLPVKSINDTTINRSTPYDSLYEKRYNEAMEWYRQNQKDKYLPIFKELAEKGYTEVEWFYGEILRDEGKFDEAVYWFRRGVKKNDAKAQNSLAGCYHSGEGVEQDYTQAAQLYKKSAEQGYYLAQSNLGEYYYYGLGVEQDYVKAAIWHKKSAEQGYAHAQYKLGISYSKGEGVEQDYNEALKWTTKAAEQDYAGAQYNLGYIYVFGEGVKQDFNEAIK